MVAGCGIDTEEVVRFEKHLAAPLQSTFIKTILSEKEFDNYISYGLNICLPLAFSCKEAMFKALGESWTTSPMEWKDIELIFNEHPSEKKYHISLKNHAQKLFNNIKATKILSDYCMEDSYITFKIILIGANNF